MASNLSQLFSRFRNILFDVALDINVREGGIETKDPA
jgi:hypothetical protein